jgi:hypothetical protein
MTDSIDIHCLAFLAGGISDTPDWQHEFLTVLSNCIDNTWVMFNPRRPTFDVTDHTMETTQIQWEYRYLQRVDVAIFWFPPETACPITLFELGGCMARQQPIIVGCHPNYIHRHNVIEQLSLARPEIHVRTSLDGVELDILRLYRDIKQARTER